MYVSPHIPNKQSCTVSDLHKCVFFLSQHNRWTLIYYLNVTPEDSEYTSVGPSIALWC